MPVDTDFDKSLDAYNHGMRLEDAITQLAERQAYIVINNPELDPEYKVVIEGLMGEIALAIAPFDRALNWYSTYVFISAKGSLTPYHMDREMNFLLQICGNKRAQLWSPDDDRVMSAAMQDKLMADRGEPRPAYSPELEKLASEFLLGPGIGVHHPFIAPHVVKTGAEPSISLALTFRTARSDTRTDAHCFNHHIRRLGIHPIRAGRYALLDFAKAQAIRIVRRAKRVAVSFVGRPGARQSG